MTARILVVDDVSTNVKLLEARLMAEYFQVLTANNGPDALGICEKGHCDIVLLDVMMPGMDGYEVCRRLKANPETMHLPVVMVTALDGSKDKLRGLEAGADDFLTKPVNDLALVTRVKSLARLKLLTDDLRLRAANGDALAIESIHAPTGSGHDGRTGRIAVIDDNAGSYSQIVSVLANENHVDVITNPHETLISLADGEYDLAILSTMLEGHDSLRLCSHIRSVEKTRSLPLLIVAGHDQNELVSRALEMGVNDYVHQPISEYELKARVRTQLTRKHYNDALRESVKHTMEMAVKDPLTSLYNRRYFETHYSRLLKKSAESGEPLSLIVCDIDRFKEVNDTYGHDIGDQVIRDVAKRITRNIRQIDLACRYGGEEFVLLMPETEAGFAELVCERIRREIETHPVIAKGGVAQISVTVSMGVASGEASDTTETLFKRADAALYDAKNSGRNKIVLAA